MVTLIWSKHLDQNRVMRKDFLQFPQEYRFIVLCIYINYYSDLSKIYSFIISRQVF